MTTNETKKQEYYAPISNLHITFAEEENWERFSGTTAWAFLHMVQRRLIDHKENDMSIDNPFPAPFQPNIVEAWEAFTLHHQCADITNFVKCKMWAAHSLARIAAHITHPELDMQMDDPSDEVISSKAVEDMRNASDEMLEKGVAGTEGKSTPLALLDLLVFEDRSSAMLMTLHDKDGESGEVRNLMGVFGSANLFLQEIDESDMDNPLPDAIKNMNVSINAALRYMRNNGGDSYPFIEDDGVLQTLVDLAYPVTLYQHDLIQFSKTFDDEMFGYFVVGFLSNFMNHIRGIAEEEKDAENDATVH